MEVSDYANQELLQIEEISPQEREKIEKSLKCLKGLIHANDSLISKIPPEYLRDEKLLLRFIRVRKFDCERAQLMMKEYFNLRRKNKIFRNLVPSQYKNSLDSGMHVVLKERDKLGRKVYLFRIELWNPSEVPLEHIIAGTALIMEEIVDSEKTQKNGIVFVGDQTSLGLNHFRQFSINKVLTILGVLQGKFPLLCKGLHSINEPNWLMKLGIFAKPFFSLKLQKRVFFHGDNFETLHAHIPPEILPISLGGNLSWEEATDNELFQRIFQKEAFFRKIADFCDS